MLRRAGGRRRRHRRRRVRQPVRAVPLLALGARGLGALELGGLRPPPKLGVVRLVRAVPDHRLLPRDGEPARTEERRRHVALRPARVAVDRLALRLGDRHLPRRLRRTAADRDDALDQRRVHPPRAPASRPRCRRRRRGGGARRGARRAVGVHAPCRAAWRTGRCWRSTARPPRARPRAAAPPTARPHRHLARRPRACMSRAQHVGADHVVLPRVARRRSRGRGGSPTTSRGPSSGVSACATNTPFVPSVVELLARELRHRPVEHAAGELQLSSGSDSNSASCAGAVTSLYSSLSIASIAARRGLRPQAPPSATASASSNHSAASAASRRGPSLVAPRPVFF